MWLSSSASADGSLQLKYSTPGQVWNTTESKSIILTLKTFKLHWSSTHRARLNIARLVEAPRLETIRVHDVATYGYNECTFNCDGFCTNSKVVINLHLDSCELSDLWCCHFSEYARSCELVMVGWSATIVILTNLFGPFYRLDSSMIRIGQMLTDVDRAIPIIW